MELREAVEHAREDQLADGARDGREHTSQAGDGLGVCLGCLAAVQPAAAGALLGRLGRRVPLLLAGAPGDQVDVDADWHALVGGRSPEGVVVVGHRVAA